MSPARGGQIPLTVALLLRADTYIGAGVESSGRFDCPHNDSYLLQQFAPYWARGLSVTPALSLTNASVTSGSALKHVAEVAAFAQKINGKRSRPSASSRTASRSCRTVSGFMLDFEPATSEVAWVHAYADYVAAFTKAMHAAGLQAEMCVSDWGILDGHFLKSGEGYGVYARTGVDKLMSMAGTYYGSNLTKDLHNVDLELEQGVSLRQLAVGIGTQINPAVASGCPVPGPMGCKAPGGHCYNWTESRLKDFVAEMVSRKVTTIDMWRADIDREGDCTEPYYFDVAERFLAGGDSPVAAMKTDDPRLGLKRSHAGRGRRLHNRVADWPNPLPGGEPLNARKDFGCAGDGVADDWLCLQSAVDAAIRQGRQLRVPAGRYMVSRPVEVAGSNTTNQSTGVKEQLSSLHLVGDGKGLTQIKASVAMLAVVYYPTCCGAMAPYSSGQYIGHISINADGKADYGVLGPSVSSSFFEAIYVTNAPVAGMFVTSWCNRVVQSEFESNYIGLVVITADNNVEIEDCIFVDGVVGIYIGGGAQVRVSGCDIEGNAGPGVIVFGCRGLALEDNYFVRQQRIS